MTAPEKHVIIVVGPTASGKTTLAIELAKHFHTEIISADSRQCYQELNIGVARPSPEELATVPHHFIASHTVHQELTAVDFEQFALEKTRELFLTKDVVVMVGGTGLYIRAFCEGFDPVPAVAPSVRAGIVANYNEKGIEWLQQELKEKDPRFAAVGEMMNPQRMMRALEVIESTGNSITDFQKGNKLVRPFKISKIALGLPGAELRDRISQRVDQMMQKGLLEEVKGLLPFQELNTLRTVGYAELFDHLDGKTSLEKAVDLIKIHTRQYAKRQLTWFRKDESIEWFGPSEAEKIIDGL